MQTIHHRRHVNEFYYSWSPREITGAAEIVEDPTGALTRRPYPCYVPSSWDSPTRRRDHRLQWSTLWPCWTRERTLPPLSISFTLERTAAMRAACVGGGGERSAGLEVAVFVCFCTTTHNTDFWRSVRGRYQFSKVLIPQ